MTGRRDPWVDADLDRFAVFVPAIMSAGLLFSIVTLVRDALHGRQHRHRERRVAIAAAVAAGTVTTGAAPGRVLERVLRPRSAYLVTALTCIGGASYAVLAAVGSYGRDGGSVAHIAWLLAVSIIMGVLLVWLGLAAGALYARYPVMPAWAIELLIATPLGQELDADREGSRRRFLLGWTATVAVLAFAVITLGVGSTRGTFAAIDEGVVDAVRHWHWLERIEWVHVLGRTEAAVGAAVLVGIATLRCLPFAAAYIGAVVVSLGTTTVVRSLVERERPPGTTLSGWEDSYPSGHVVQAVLLAGLVPLAVHVLTRRAWLVRAVAVALAVATGLGALLRIERGLHWPTDVLGSLALGTAVVLVVHWSLARPAVHGRCHGCPWSPGPGPEHTLVDISDDARRRVRRASRALALGSIAAFAVLMVTVGIPRNPDGESVDASVEVVGTTAALTVLALSLVLSLRLPLVGAVGLAGGGLILGVLSAVAYHPTVAVAVAATFGLPAVGLWLSWQHGRTRRAVVAVAVVCALAATSVYAAAANVHERFYGPFHPTSATPALPVDDVVWAWSGGIRPDGFQVVAQVAEHHRRAALVVEPVGGDVVTRTDAVRVPPSGIVHFAVAGLAPGTQHRYAIEVDGVLDGARGAGRSRTAPVGPSDLRIAVASCARVGSSGRVFDAIRSNDPDLYLITGDIHYGNLASDDLGEYRSLLRRVLTSPAQAALYRDVPIAYVWDDHDYGADGADSTSVSRDAARTGYRELVPNLAAPSGPINQAFTMGRVRIVMTDTRSARTADTMLGEAQLHWLIDELRRSSETHALVVWVNAVPWIAPAEPGRDDWGGYAAEREQILAAIRSASIQNLVMLSGDAHMVALDDGTHSGGFPVLHAGALDRPGNTKGGPYSDGAFPGAGQFGLVDVRDGGGDRVEVTLSGHTWDGRVLVRRSFEIPVPTGASAADEPGS